MVAELVLRIEATSGPASEGAASCSDVAEEEPVGILHRWPDNGRVAELAADSGCRRPHAASGGAGAPRKCARRLWGAEADGVDSDVDSTALGSEEGLSEWALSPPESPRLGCGGGPVCDVLANAAGEPVLLPVGGSEFIEVSNLDEDALVTVRVFRFFEDRDDEARPWEQELRNVNSGSLLWLLVHLLPKMHSVSGAKYGRWFTVHHIRIYAKHFKSGYFMSEEGGCMAKTFGATIAIKSLVSGEVLPTGYFWFVSPDRRDDDHPHKDVADEVNLQEHGWQHLGREGPYDGRGLLDEWRRQGSPRGEEGLREVLARATKSSS